MAYAALISLANTIDRILNQNRFSISLEEKQQIISLHEHATPFQAFLEKFPDKFNSLEARMREVTNEAEDTLEYLVLEKVFPASDGELGCLEKVMEEIYLIAGEVKVVEKVMDLMKKIEHTESSALNSLSSAPPIRADAVVGFEDYVKQVKDRLCGEQSKLQVIPICGMGGIGKTTLAKKVYEDPCIVEEFVVRVWVTISQDYSVQRIVSTLLESLKEFSTGIWGPNDEERVRKILMLRKYLVVMDDMWSREAWDAVRRVFPDVGNGSCIMLTTRLSDVASHPDPSSKLCEMQLMNADQSWSLLKQKVFIDEDCPFQLEEIGKEIARSCKGLPLAIVVIAGLLSTVSRDPASWQEIAKKVKSAKTAEQEQIEEILSLSYAHLPQYLRPCFMYMGSFPEDQEINVSRLVRLWVAEGFVKRPNSSESLEEEAEECLEDLVKRNLVLVVERKCDGRIKSCSLHDMMRDLSIRKAHETCLNDLVHLHQLESLEIYAGCWVLRRPKYYNFTFPMKLKKLCLRDLRLPWNDMIVVGSLPDLRVLKIKGRSCVGSTWETTQGQFPQLEFLLIEASNFENWITESSHFPRLKRLVLDSWWYLNGIPSDIGEISTLELIEIKGKVKKSLVKSAEEIQNEQEDMGNNTLQVLWTNAKPFR